MSLEIPQPNFIIIGSAKCGTTTLAKILDDHPECCFSQPKEVNFFTSNKNYSQGWDYYQQVFSHYNNEPVVGEATPAYSNRIAFPETAQRIYHFSPQMKLIYIVREPYQKFLSMWKMEHRAAVLFADSKNVTIDYNALAGLNAYFDNVYYGDKLRTCCFYFQLQAYLDLFPADHIYIVFLEDLKKDINHEMTRICKFLEINPEKLVIQNEEGENRAIAFIKKHSRNTNCGDSCVNRPSNCY
ncbi:MAG: sulfotransferase domain-containing protein [Oscillatoriales cyanobacterium RM1_1_9]|nr:sulfotransferase domain-containing protein [Oscillatoriales cyanobacterium RM1_1_9]